MMTPQRWPNHAWLTVCLTLILLTLSACGGGGASSSSNGGSSGSCATPASGSGPVAAADNVATVSFERCPSLQQVNAPFVSITLCVPGTSTCQTIDHILVDTGSYGLRLHASALTLESSLPAVTNSSGLPVATCAQFASGYAWGSVRRADFSISGKSVANMPIEVIGDSNSPYTSIPSACSSTGSNYGSTPTTLGGNGILGVGMQTQDCGSSCTTNANVGIYYSCSGSNCGTGTRLVLANQVANPIPSFSGDNNGLTLVVPSVALGQSTKSLLGSLVFGVNTRSNNTIASGATYLQTNDKGRFTTSYQGTAYESFIDSGSNGLFFPDSTLATTCTGFYCPSTTPTRSATLISSDGGTSRSVNFWVENVNTLPSTTVVSHLGGEGAIDNTFDWGAPFFFGRTVHMVLPSQTVNSKTGPFWAF